MSSSEEETFPSLEPLEELSGTPNRPAILHRQTDHHCPMCDLRFPSTSHVLHHLEQQHHSAPDPQPPVRQEHVTNTTSAKTYRCRLCGETFNESKFYNEHNCSAPKFSCLRCSFSTNSGKALIKHNQGHWNASRTKPRPASPPERRTVNLLVCDETAEPQPDTPQPCLKPTITSSPDGTQNSEHAVVCSPTTFTCPMCPFECSAVEEIQEHLGAHRKVALWVPSGPKLDDWDPKVQCFRCLKTFKEDNIYRFHVTQCWPKVLACGMCAFGCFSDKLMWQHYKSEHVLFAKLKDCTYHYYTNVFDDSTLNLVFLSAEEHSTCEGNTNNNEPDPNQTANKFQETLLSTEQSIDSNEQDASDTNISKNKRKSSLVFRTESGPVMKKLRSIPFTKSAEIPNGRGICMTCKQYFDNDSDFRVHRKFCYSKFFLCGGCAFSCNEAHILKHHIENHHLVLPRQQSKSNHQLESPPKAAKSPNKPQPLARAIIKRTPTKILPCPVVSENTPSTEDLGTPSTVKNSISKILKKNTPNMPTVTLTFLKKSLKGDKKNIKKSDTVFSVKDIAESAAKKIIPQPQMVPQQVPQQVVLVVKTVPLKLSHTSSTATPPPPNPAACAASPSGCTASPSGATRQDSDVNLERSSKSPRPQSVEDCSPTTHQELVREEPPPPPANIWAEMLRQIRKEKKCMEETSCTVLQTPTPQVNGSVRFDESNHIDHDPPEEMEESQNLPTLENPPQEEMDDPELLENSAPQNLPTLEKLPQEEKNDPKLLENSVHQNLPTLEKPPQEEMDDAELLENSVPQNFPTLEKTPQEEMDDPELLEHSVALDAPQNLEAEENSSDTLSAVENSSETLTATENLSVHNMETLDCSAGVEGFDTPHESPLNIEMPESEAVADVENPSKNFETRPHDALQQNIDIAPENASISAVAENSIGNYDAWQDESSHSHDSIQPQENLHINSANIEKDCTSLPNSPDTSCVYTSPGPYLEHLNYNLTGMEELVAARLHTIPAENQSYCAPRQLDINAEAQKAAGEHEVSLRVLALTQQQQVQSAQLLALPPAATPASSLRSHSSTAGASSSLATTTINPADQARYICKLCNKEFPYFLRVFYHISKFHVPLIYCFCNQQLETLDALQSHLLLQHTFQNSMLYVKQGLLNIGAVIEYRRPSAACMFCELTFPTFPLLHSHICSSHRNFCSSCQVLVNGTEWMDHLTDHMWSEYFESPLDIYTRVSNQRALCSTRREDRFEKCPYCNFENTPELLARHIAEHSLVKCSSCDNFFIRITMDTTQCRACLYSYNTKSSNNYVRLLFLQTEQNEMTTSNDDILPCIFCTKVFHPKFTVRVLADHISQDHHVCRVCMISFSEHQDLVEHNLTHVGRDIWMHSCKVCQTRCESIRVYAEHRKAHEDFLELGCTVVNKIPEWNINRALIKKQCVYCHAENVTDMKLHVQLAHNVHRKE